MQTNSSVSCGVRMDFKQEIKELLSEKNPPRSINSVVTQAMLLLVDKIEELENRIKTLETTK